MADEETDSVHLLYMLKPILMWKRKQAETRNWCFFYLALTYASHAQAAPAPEVIWKYGVLKTCRRVVPSCHYDVYSLWCSEDHVVSCRRPSRSPVARCVVPSWRHIVPLRRAVARRVVLSRRAVARRVVPIVNKLTWQHELRRHDATGDGMTRRTTARCDGTTRRQDATQIWRL